MNKLDFLKRARRRLGKSQADVAFEVGVSQGYVSGWERVNGEIKLPRAALWIDIAAAYGISVAKLANILLVDDSPTAKRKAS